MGIFYQAITQYLGFPDYGDEYKVMGLASYGSPKFVTELREVLQVEKSGRYSLCLPYFRHHREALTYQWRDGIPRFDSLYSKKLEQLLGPSRAPGQTIASVHQDIAASAQSLYEEVLFGILNQLHRDTGVDYLALAGGCAMNSVANGKILQNTNFSNVYVQPAAGDAGGAIGSALVVWQKLAGTFTKPVMPDAYLGPGYSHDEIESLLQASADQLDTREFRIEHWVESALVQHVAKAIEGGAVIGWFQGRMEWGPRALGNRSILADPRRSDIQDLLNNKIKRRESFRPFAPSILSEQVGEWFEVEDQAPFMEKVYQIKPQKHDVIPAVTHVDGTGRLQTVDREGNSRYYSLINAFFELTGVPILLNTSFNENEPIVCTPEQALQCFLRTKMDMLVLENFTITRINST
jgi:carbamoyltransferase